MCVICRRGWDNVKNKKKSFSSIQLAIVICGYTPPNAISYTEIKIVRTIWFLLGLIQKRCLCVSYFYYAERFMLRSRTNLLPKRVIITFFLKFKINIIIYVIVNVINVNDWWNNFVSFFFLDRTFCQSKSNQFTHFTCLLSYSIICTILSRHSYNMSTKNLNGNCCVTVSGKWRSLAQRLDI